jgi:hypothetical protein
MKSNKMHPLFWLAAILACLADQTISAQEFITTRKISLTKGDTAVVAGILADAKVEKINQIAFYHWYSNGRLYSNQGGYSGNLLHGEYLEYDPEGTLILKGYYDKGLRSGRWTYWYREGSVRETIEYEGGLLNGRTIRYGEDGRICYYATYRDDLLHGEVNTVANDSLFRITYRNGQTRKKMFLRVF